MSARRGLSQKLLSAFLGVIAALALVNAFFFMSSFPIIRSYNQVVGNMVLEQKIVDNIQHLVLSYQAFVRNENDIDQVNTMVSLRDEINADLAELDGRIFSDESRIEFLGLRNMSVGIIDTCFRGVSEIEDDDFSRAYSYFDEASLAASYVRNTGAALIDTEVVYLISISEELDRSRQLVILFGVLLAAIVVLGSIMYAVSFSRRISLPVQEITDSAERVAGGDLDVYVSQDILARDDEVGRLARSFESMVATLRSNMQKLEGYAKWSTEARDMAEQERDATSRINMLMSGREKRLMKQTALSAKSENSKGIGGTFKDNPEA